MNWLKEWAEQAKEVLLSPSDFYDDLDRRKNYKYPIKFAVTSGIVSAILIFIVQEIQLLAVAGFEVPAQMTGLRGLVLLLAAGVFGGTAGLLINSGFIHIFSVLFGFKGYQKTTEAVSYPTAINALLSWIPLVNIFAFFYILYAEVRGMEKIHGMSTGKALASVILGMILLAVTVFGFILVTSPYFYESLDLTAHHDTATVVEAVF